MANEMLQARHGTYYLDSEMIVLSCGGKLFKVPYWHLEKYSPALLPSTGLNTDGTLGTSDDTAIPIDHLVSVEEFETFLDFFYRGVLRNEIPIREWCKLIVISSKLNSKDLRTRAIDELSARKKQVSPVDRIELGNDHNIPQWLSEAYAEVFVRQSHLTVEEGKQLGLEITVKVLKGRDTCRRNGWDTPSSGVTQLVKEIFPSSGSPVSPVQQRKKAGTNVYGDFVLIQHLHRELPMADASGLAPMAPTSPPSSRTPEPSPAMAGMVQTMPPKFVFGTGSGSSSFEFDPPPRNESVYRHPKYYMDTDMVVFQVHSCLYRVHKHFFLSEAGFFKDMFALPPPVDEGEEKPKEGTTDETAINIPDVTIKEFEALLDFFYYRKSSKEEKRSLDQWVSLLSISTRFQLDRIRRRAINEIESHNPQPSAVDKVVLAVKHSVEHWLIPAYCDICERTEPLTDQEAEKLGAVTTARLARGRELLRKSGRPFPLLVDSTDSKKASRKHTESIVAQVLAPSKVVQGLFSSHISSNSAFLLHS